jgi:hypothetical protein
VIAAFVWSLGAWCASGAVAPGEGAAARLVVLPPVWWLPALLALVVTAARLCGVGRAHAAPLWLPVVSLVPTLPIPLPAAMLLWIGPLGQLLAAAALAATLWIARRGCLDRRRLRPAAAALVPMTALLYLTAAWAISPRLPGGDEPHYLVITQSLLNDGDLRIEDNHQRREYAAYVDGTLRPDYLRRGRDGAIYSIHAPGVAALVLPAFALGGYPAVVLLLAVLSACALVPVWRAANEIAGPGAAMFATAAVGLSVPFFFQSMTIYPDGPAAVIVAVVLWLTVSRGVASPRSAVLAGVLLGALPWLHTRYALIAAALGVIVVARILWPADDRVRGATARPLMAFIVPAVVSAAAWFAMFQSIYGTWDPRAPYGHATDMRLGRIPHGIAGLLLDQQFGLLPNAPVYALAFAGLWPLWQRSRRVAVELVAVVSPYALAVAGFHMWWGGRSSPVRFLVPILLPMALPIAAWVGAPGRGRTGRAVAAVLLGASLLITTAFVLVDRGALVYNSRDGHALWLLAASAATNLTFGLPSLFQGSPPAAWLTAAGWIGSAALVVLALNRVSAVLSPARWTAAVLAGLVGFISAGATFGWARAGATGRDPGAGTLAAIALACENATLAVRTGPFRVNDAYGKTAGVTIEDASRRPPRMPVMWSASDVPPGHYRVAVRSGLNLSGTLSVAVGRPGAVIQTCAFTDAPPGTTACDVNLPAGASGLWLVGDERLQRTADSIALTLISRGVHECGWRAGRAASRDGRVLFVLDGEAFVEAGGLWTRGGGEVTLVVPASDGRARIHVRQGGATGEIRVDARGFGERRTLEPGATWDADIPIRPGDEYALVTLRSAAAFRPADRDPASTDARPLGAWVEPR